MEEKMELTELKAEKVMTIRANCPDDMRIPVGKMISAFCGQSILQVASSTAHALTGQYFLWAAQTGIRDSAVMPQSILPAWRFTRGICSRQMMVCLSRYRIPGSVINGAGSLIL